METMLKSALAGTGSDMRISPRFSSRLYAEVRAASVDTSALGQFAPSTGRNTGSLPWVDWNRCCRFGGVMVHPSATSWQLAQLRPFVPRLWKNGFERSTGPTASVLKMPLGSGNGIRFGRWNPATALNENPATSNPATASKTRYRLIATCSLVRPVSKSAQLGPGS